MIYTIFNLTTLTPAIERLRAHLAASSGERNLSLADIEEVVGQCEHAAAAFDVMMRRSWNVIRWSDTHKWTLDRLSCPTDMLEWRDANSFADPFLALIEADAWYKANVEKDLSCPITK